jgi:hypothetical protein
MQRNNVDAIALRRSHPEPASLARIIAPARRAGDSVQGERLTERHQN